MGVLLFLSTLSFLFITPGGPVSAGLPFADTRAEALWQGLSVIRLAGQPVS